MSKILETSRSKKATLQQLAEKVDHRERVEDLEDLCDLKEAVQRDGDKPLIPLAKVKKDLDINSAQSGSIPTYSSELPW